MLLHPIQSLSISVHSLSISVHSLSIFVHSLSLATPIHRRLSPDAVPCPHPTPPLTAEPDGAPSRQLGGPRHLTPVTNSDAGRLLLLLPLAALLFGRQTRHLLRVELALLGPLQVGTQGVWGGEGGGEMRRNILLFDCIFAEKIFCGNTLVTESWARQMIPYILVSVSEQRRVMNQKCLRTNQSRLYQTPRFR